MTYTQQRLLDEARESWDIGRRICTHLYASMAMEGLDVQTLEETYYKDNS